MKKKTNILIKEKYYWLSELMVKDIFELNSILGEFEDIEIADYFFNSFLSNDENNSLLSAVTNCPFNVLHTLSLSEFQKFTCKFIELNKFFFVKNKKKDTQAQAQPQDPNDSLFELCCHLVECGHINVMDYGYSYLLKAINNHEKIINSDTARIAIATRMAYHADDKSWKKYMRGLGVK